MPVQKLPIHKWCMGNAGAECAGFLEVIVPNFIDQMANEFGGCTFGSFKGGLLVMDENSIFGFHTGMDNQSCVGRIARS